MSCYGQGRGCTPECGCIKCNNPYGRKIDLPKKRGRPIGTSSKHHTQEKLLNQRTSNTNVLRDLSVEQQCMLLAIVVCCMSKNAKKITNLPHYKHVHSFYLDTLQNNRGLLSENLQDIALRVVELFCLYLKNFIRKKL